MKSRTAHVARIVEKRNAYRYLVGKSEEERLHGTLISTGLFISPSGISEIDCATTKADTAERSISIGRESLQVLFFFCTRGLGVLPGSTARGSRDEKWRSQ